MHYWRSAPTLRVSYGHRQQTKSNDMANDSSKTASAVDVSSTRLLGGMLDSMEKSGNMFRGERAAIEQALSAGDRYGYGNVISWLMTKWAVNLRDKWGMDEKTAISATKMSPYPLPPNGAGERQPAENQKP